MACRYIYKGHIFDSEIALDDFLIEKYPYESKLGDIVFDAERTTKSDEIINILQSVKKRSEEL